MPCRFKATARLFAVGLVVIAAFAAHTLPASAQGLPVRNITQNEATTTSACIGDPKTPLCAVETFLACAVRRDMSLCRRVGVDNFSFVDRVGTTEYVVTSQKTIRKKDFPDNLRNTDWYRPGNVEIYFFLRDCPPGEYVPCVYIGWHRYSAYVRPTASLWRVVDWSSEQNIQPDDSDTQPGNKKY